MWNYAELSQMAKAVGGLDKLLEEITKYGIKIGIKQANTKFGFLIPLALVVGGAFGYGTSHYFNKRNPKKQPITADEFAAAEQAIVDGINVYDKEVAENPDIKPLPEITREEAEKKIGQYVQYIADKMKSINRGGNRIDKI